MSQIYGDWEGSYKELPRWFNTVQCYAPGTIVRYATSRHDNSSSLILDRVFWAFKPCIEGFGFCKPILQVDGTFLTEKYTGTLLIASSQDGNRRIIPVAFAIVEGETKEAWEWFFYNVRMYVTPQPNICIISDRGTGLLGALRTEFPQWCNAHSVYCIRHVANNFNKEFKDGYELMWPRFERILDDLRQKNPRAAAYFSRESGVFVVEVPGRDGSRHSKYNFIRSIRDQFAPSNIHDNPMQTIHGVYLQCNEMMNAFTKLLPTSFSDNNYQAPPTNQFDMPVAPEFQQPFESQTQTDTHPQAFTQQTPVPQQQPFQFQSFGASRDYSISHQFGSSSHYEESLPSMFGTTSTTPLSAFNSQQYYQPTMPTQVDDEDDDEEDEEVPQLVRGGTKQPTQPNLRVQPPRRRKPPPCGTSSHRRH
ncbi:hypothetical protein Lal_00033226 [Lupinus albus]|nr:hypothetical protein Lal_00033226 [Lupinus albus]